jgi:predicted nuclease of predicted toxin-antitoxin system
LTRDADFTGLKSSLTRRIKVIYIQMNGDPSHLAEHVLAHIRDCLTLLERVNIAILDANGWRGGLR